MSPGAPRLQDVLAKVSPASRISDPTHRAICGVWRDVFAGPPSSWKAAALQAWEPVRARLPAFSRLQRETLIEVAPVMHEGLSGVAYLYQNAGLTYCSLGTLPLVDQEEYLARFDWLPPTFLTFYRSVHNGYGAIVDGSLGPLAMRYFREVDELDTDWGSRASELNAYEPLENRSTVLWNGARGYLVLSTEGPTDDETNALAWWLDEPPDVAPFWPLLDVWMRMGISED